MGESTVIGREPCPRCGSTDNVARYSDGHAYCFGMGCGYYEHGTGEPRAEDTEGMAGGRVSYDLVEGTFPPLPKRHLHSDTLEKYDYRIGEFQGQPCHAATYHDSKGVAVAQKLRFANKVFRWVGDSKLAGLYGQHLYKGSGRKIVVTEGEIDCLSMAQVQGLKWPVVSVPNGAASAAKAVAAQLEWLEGYAEVVFMFDNDEPGRLAAVECAEMMTPGKARIAELPLKDANEMLVAGKVDELISAMWNARVYRPDGIVGGSETWERVLDAFSARAGIMYPWAFLNEKTKGMRLGEIVTVCAGTGVGKSTACREWAYALMGTGERVGYVALEESIARTAQGFMSIEANRPLHYDRTGLTNDDLRAVWERACNHDRIYLYDHWGSIESENLVRKIKQMVRGCGVKWIVLDHISIVVSGLESSNERKDLDIVMTNLRKMAQELNVGIFLVSHLRRKDGNKGHEQGAEVSLSDLRGTQAIAQLSDIVIALERDQQAEEGANQARVRVLKNRFTGHTGLAGVVVYNEKTGRLQEGNPFEEKTDGAEQPPQAEF